MLKPVVHVHGGGTLAGGGATYVLAIARELARQGDRGFCWRFAATPSLAVLLRKTGADVTELPTVPAWKRAIWEQAALARERNEILLAAANFGPLIRRGKYVVIAHNPLHFVDPPFSGPGRMRLRAETLLARASVRRAGTVVTPSHAMDDLVYGQTGVRSQVIPFGPGLAERHRNGSGDRFVILHRTHWGPHKRFGDLLGAVRELAREAPGRFVVRTAADPRTPFAAAYAHSDGERRLLADSLVRSHVDFAPFELGSTEQRELVGDAVVVPSATESFCFPLAEGVFFGLPTIVADRPFAREMCGDSAVYIRPGDVAALATAMRRVIDGWRPPHPPGELVRRLDWTAHVDRLVDVLAQYQSES